MGHYIGSLKNRIALQHTYRQYILIADVQALTDNAENPQKVRENVVEVALDYLAVGLQPEYNTFCVQSLVPELAELTMYYLNLVTLARLKRNPTVKDEMHQKGFADNVPTGFLVRIHRMDRIGKTRQTSSCSSCESCLKIQFRGRLIGRTARFDRANRGSNPRP